MSIEIRRKSERGNTVAPAARMANFRQRKRKSGAHQITAHLSPEASALFKQMLKFSGKPIATLISDAVYQLAYNYRYWDVAPPPDDIDNYDYDELDTSHFEDHWRGSYRPNPMFRGDAAPPWIVERDRRIAAERKAFANEAKRASRRDDALDVYTKGVTPRNK